MDFRIFMKRNLISIFAKMDYSHFPLMFYNCSFTMEKVSIGKLILSCVLSMLWPGKIFFLKPRKLNRKIGILNSLHSLLLLKKF